MILNTTTDYRKVVNRKEIEENFEKPLGYTTFFLYVHTYNHIL